MLSYNTIASTVLQCSGC